MVEFNAGTAIDVGGWSQFARVIDVQVDGDVAAALIDANGDGADLNVEIYVREDDQWIEAASGNGSLEIPGVRATWSEPEDQLILVRTHDRPF